MKIFSVSIHIIMKIIESLMDETTLPHPLRGIIPPMVTPLLDRDTLDIQGLERLIERILAGGVHGLFILGTTGEGPGLSFRLRHELIERTCTQVAGRVPVLVGISDTAYAESLNIAQKAKHAGAQAVVLAPPYYYPAGQPELLEYLEHLVSELTLPLFLYNMPSHTKLEFDPETILKATDIPGIIGLKDSSANMFYFNRVKYLLQDKPEFSLLIGPEELLGETVLLGAHGGISGGANLFPKLYVDLYNAAVAHDIKRVHILHDKVMLMRATIYSVGKYNSSLLKGLKCALSYLNICNDFMAEPFHRFREAERKIIIQHLDKFKEYIEAE